MKFDRQKIAQYTKKFIKYLPVYFEKYETFIIVSGAFAVFLFAGFIFYANAYNTVKSTPEVDVSVTKVRSDLLDKTIEELDQRKKAAPDLPIIDPFK